jgi:hypothetical protein
MSNVTFEEPEYNRNATSRPQKISFLTDLTIKTGLAKDEAGAQRVMLIVTVVVVLLAVAVYVFFVL